ncbi:MAG: metallophosphoesterase [Thermoanaerobaculia bacterium]|nr:metallophosphoesterase [Thermoanaerobaculia bacterium]
MRHSILGFALLLLSACARSHESVPVVPVRVTLPMKSETLRLVLTSDLHTFGGPKIAGGIAKIHAEKPLDAILITGDNFHPCGVSSIDEPLQWQYVLRHLSPLGIPMYPLLGNHDYGNPKKRFFWTRICGDPNPQAQIDASRVVPNWKFPARNYVISTAVADIVMTDSTPVALDRSEPLRGSASADAIRAFTREQLALSRGKFRIVAGHHNIRYSGKLRMKSKPTRTNMDAFGELLTEANADLYVCGHQHQLELIVPPDDAPVMLISGASSRPKPTEQLSRRDEYSKFVSGFPRRGGGFAVLEVSRTWFRVTFYDRSGKAISRPFRFDRIENDRLRFTPE